MIPSHQQLRSMLRMCIGEAAAQGFDDVGLYEDLDAVPDSYDALLAFAEEIAARPLRADWPFVEPLDFDSIRAEWAPDAPAGALGDMSVEEKCARVEAAFYGRIAGCILGKPVEVAPTADQLRGALEPLGHWPLHSWVPEEALDKIGSLGGYKQPQWVETVAGRINYVTGDDDINYCVLGTLLVERKGAAFTGADVQKQWQLQLSPGVVFGPERTMLLRRATTTMLHEVRLDEDDAARWPTVLNPGSEHCGAFIRVDAYAWAALGQPALAAELAYRDAATTHVRTGVYSSMWIAALLAAAPFVDAWDDLARLALAYVPQRSRFADVVRESIDDVGSADDWWSANRKLVARRPEAIHCLITQEVGTLLNTLRFAENTGHGICLQVSQGNDTDSFGATAGSMLGLRFGAEGLDHDQWIKPFNDDLRLAMILPPERSLAAMAARAGRLPAVL